MNKKTEDKLYDLFDSLSVADTDEAVKGGLTGRIDRKTRKRIRQRVLAGMNGGREAAVTRSRARGWSGWARAAAVCAVLLVAVGAGALTTVVEAAQYKQAVEFFAQNDLPTEGLERGELKRIHKDISMGTFSYEKTTEVFRTISIALNVASLGESPSREDFKAMWTLWQQAQSNEEPGSRIEVAGIYDDEYNLVGTSVTRFENGRVVWRYTDDEWGYVGGGYIETAHGVYVYGTKAGQDLWSGRLLLLGNDGSLLWKKTAASPTGWVIFDTAIAQDDSIVVFGTKEYRENGQTTRYVLVQKYGRDGALLWSRENPAGTYHAVSLAVPTDNGYLIKLNEYYGNGGLLSVTEEGAFAEAYTYSIDGKEYAVQDILVRGDKVYLSAMAANASEEDFDSRFNAMMVEYYNAVIAVEPDIEEDYFNENADISRGIVDMPEEYQNRLLELFQTQYTAALLTSGPDGVIQNVQVVENARAGRLAATEAGLTQQVFRIDDAQTASLLISLYRVNLSGTEFSCVYDAGGNLLEKLEVGPYSALY